MSWYPVARPDRPRVDALAVLAGGLAALAALVLLHHSFSRIDVRVDGRSHSLPARTTVSELLASGLCEGTPGDLLAVDGSVIEKGAGKPVRVTVADRPASEETVLRPLADVRTADGGDEVEPVVTRRRAIPIPLAVEGEGPLLRLKATGAAGVALVREGAISGAVVSSETITPAAPMAVLRLQPVSLDEGPKVALTFDDGPWPEHTEAVLDILEREQVKATFFLVGDRVRRQPAVARRIVRDGHLIGNHTENHALLPGAGVKVVRRQIRTATQTIEKVTGEKPRWFRPPGGGLDAVVLDEARRAGQNVAMWTVDPQDWRKPRPGPMTRQVIAEIEPGGVILLHDGGGDRSATIRALPWIIHELQRDGYRFVTLDELGDET